MFGLAWLTHKMLTVAALVLLTSGILAAGYYLVWNRGYEAANQKCLEKQIAAAKKEDSIKTEMDKEVQKQLQGFLKAQIALAKSNVKLKQEFKDDTEKNCPQVDPNSASLLLTSDQLHVLDRAFGLSGSDPKGATSGVSRSRKNAGKLEE